MQKQFIVNNKTVIYQSETGALELKTDIQHETIWLTQQQVAELFDVQKAAISKHLKNIFSSGELQAKATVSKKETVQIERKRSVKRTIEYYNLDLVLSIGYRVNSKQATQFRQWATKTLKKHILKGYTINETRIQKNYTQFLQAVEDVKSLLLFEIILDNNDALELIKLFADTWFSLDAFDKGKLVTIGTTKKKIKLSAKKLTAALAKLKEELILKGEATDIFGVERTKNSVETIFGNIMQSFAGQELYQSVEEKAAHLLYCLVKNRPFIDGNKRCGAYAFVWFLRQTKLLDFSQITPPALTALTLLIAESNPKHKDKMIGLVCNVLIRN